jgi:hypothetical protein
MNLQKDCNSENVVWWFQMFFKTKKMIAASVIALSLVFCCFDAHADDRAMLAHVKYRLISDGYDRETIENL